MEVMEETSSTLSSLIKVTTRKQSTDRDLGVHTHVTVVFYVLVILFCLTSNLVLNYLLFTRKYMRIKYIFTASISFSHIIICVGVIPLAISIHMTHDDTKGKNIACDVIVSYCIGVTSYSMLATAVRRCLAISERFRHANFTYRGKVKNIVFVWIFALATSVPYIFNEDTTNVFTLVPNFKQHCCVNGTTNDEIITLNGIYRNVSYVIRQKQNRTESATAHISAWTSFGAFTIYNAILFLIQMFIPCLTALILQTFTLMGLKKRPNQIHWVKEIMITKQHICMAITFIVCWLPLTVTNIVSDYSNIHEITFHILQPFALSSIVYFPVIYYYLNAHIKREFLLLVQGIVNR